MGSRVGTGISPGESRARTGAAVGPGSISGLSRSDANQVLSRAERLRGNNLTPEIVNIAAQSLGINRDRPGTKSFALPPSVRDKDIQLEYIEKFDGPPSMTIPPEIQLPQQPPGYQFIPELPSAPPGYVPQEIFPNTAPPGTPEINMMPMPFRRGFPPVGQRLEPLALQRGIAPRGLESLIIQDLIDRGLLDG